jgi:hypothetical protein
MDARPEVADRPAIPRPRAAEGEWTLRWGRAAAGPDAVLDARAPRLPVPRTLRAGTVGVPAGPADTPARTVAPAPRRWAAPAPVERVHRLQPGPGDAAGAPVPRPAPAPARPRPDPVDLDRLGDDLWKRFEKRIRVERERQGRR